MPASFGFQAKAYANTGTYASPVWVEQSAIVDMELPLDSEEVDLTNRASGGVKEVLYSLLNVAIDFSIIRPLAADLTRFKTAYYGRSGIEMAIMDGDITTSGTDGFRATWCVPKLKRDEKLKDAIKYDVTIKPTPGAFTAGRMTVA